jgi:hypothetical protein
MRRVLIRGGVAVVLLPILWYLTSRWSALLVDQFYTPRLAALQSAPIGWNGTWLQIGIGFFDKVVPNGYRADFTGMGPDYKQIARFIVDADDRLVFVKDDARFVLGPHTGTLPDPIDRSLLSWPAPLFQFNFMTGYTPSWQRNIYQRFSWTKASGARLDILWRYRQDYDDVNGWTGMMLNDLIRIELRPTSGSPVRWVETVK